MPTTYVIELFMGCPVSFRQIMESSYMSAWAFCVVRSDGSGQCEGLSAWNGQRQGSTLFSYI